MLVHQSGLLGSALYATMERLTLWLFRNCLDKLIVIDKYRLLTPFLFGPFDLAAQLRYTVGLGLRRHARVVCFSCASHWQAVSDYCGWGRIVS